jgi:hypothetical protein
MTWQRVFNNPLRVPRAGIGVPRVRLAPKSLEPSKPNVRQPAVWSWPVQQILGQAQYGALSSLAEERQSSDDDPWAKLHSQNEVEKRIFTDPVLKLEFYERATQIIARAKPSDGFSDRGAPVDRAEARLRLWLILYAGYSR